MEKDCRDVCTPPAVAAATASVAEKTLSSTGAGAAAAAEAEAAEAVSGCLRWMFNALNDWVHCMASDGWKRRKLAWRMGVWFSTAPRLPLDFNRPSDTLRFGELPSSSVRVNKSWQIRGESVAEP
jgi:hypothetical protein